MPPTPSSPASTGPRTFEDLYGQEAMVRTLRNAFRRRTASPHAFMLTGVRGVGKAHNRTARWPGL
jgi:DNA polymerase III gamma/tau subunit